MKRPGNFFYGFMLYSSPRCDLYKKYLTGATFIRFPEKENRKIPRAF